MVLHIISFSLTLNAFYRHPHCQWERILSLAPSRHYLLRCNSYIFLLKLYFRACMESHNTIPDYNTHLQQFTNSNDYIVNFMFIDLFIGQQARYLRCTSVTEGWYCLNSPPNWSQQKNSPKKVQGSFWVTCKARQEGHVAVWEERVWGGSSKRDLFYLGLWWDQKREANSSNRSQRYQLKLKLQHVFIRFFQVSSYPHILSPHLLHHPYSTNSLPSSLYEAWQISQKH